MGAFFCTSYEMSNYWGWDYDTACENQREREKKRQGKYMQK